MLAYDYTFLNNFNGETFTIGINAEGDRVCDVGRGIMLQAYPTFELEVRNDQRNKAGQHGIWDFFSFYGKRNITFSGVILASSHSDLKAFQDKMKEVLTLPSQPLSNVNDGYVTISWIDADGGAWQLDAKIQRDIQFSRNIGNRLSCSFFLSMKADTPYIISTDSFTESQVLGWRGGQMLLSAFLPSKLNIKYNEVLNIYQAGTAEAPTTYRISGPGTDLKVTKLVESFFDTVVLSDFSSGWVGGVPDTTHFQTAGVARKLTSTGAQDTMTLTQAFDLNGNDFITFYFFVDNIDNIAIGDYTLGQNYIKFIDTSGVDEFVLEFEAGNDTIRNGWNYFIDLKHKFKTIGSPSWTSITAVEFSIKAKTGTTLNVTFDDLLHQDILFDLQQKLELNTTLTADQYVDFDVALGTITRNDGVDMSGYLTSDSSWFWISPRQNLLLCESSDNNPNVTYEFPYAFRTPVDSPSIIGYWAFDDKSLTQVTDFVGSDNGVFVGSGLNYLSSTVNGSQYALHFPGTGGYVSVETPFRTVLSFSAGAVALRFQTASFAADFTLLYQYFGIADSRIEYDQGSDELRIIYKLDNVTKTIAIASFSSSYSVDTWISVLVNYDVSVGVDVYIDNVLAGTDATTGSDFDTGILTSRFGTNASGDDLTGLLDEIRYYSGGTLDTDTRTLLFTDASQEKYKNQLTVTWHNAQI